MGRRNPFKSRPDLGRIRTSSGRRRRPVFFLLLGTNGEREEVANRVGLDEFFWTRCSAEGPGVAPVCAAPGRAARHNRAGPALPRWQMCGSGSGGAVRTCVAPPVPAPQKRVRF